ncbi:MAG: glycoside hydrolase family 2 TIM barrel-domain containing protein [Candidatus Nanopelagicaceae bacterium]
MENIWNSPETSSVNRLPMLNLEHPTYLSLDGTWNFQLIANPSAPLGNWQKLNVPGLWTMVDGQQPFGDKPIYTNTQMPWDHFAPTVPEDNPTGIYERTFNLSENLVHKRVVLQIGATESVHILYINGEAVGAGKDSHLASEYDLTNFVKAGENTIRIKVIKWSDATYIEDQDQWWHGGISRSIKLYFTDQVFIERLYATPTLLADNKTGKLNIRAHINSIDNQSFVNYKLQARSTGKSKAKAEAKVIQKSAPNWTEKTIEEFEAGKDFFQATYWDGNIPKAAKAAWLATESIIPGPLEFEVKLPVSPWSAESPTLYEVEYVLTNPNGKVVQTATQKVGFRRVEIKGNELLLNGQPIIFYGINRHDFNKRTGRVISAADYRADLMALKANNFNAVRTSHYPNDPVFLSLCDELGIYVIDEANIESHAFQNLLCDDQKYLSQWVDRIARMVQRDIHHASAVLWSLGNESGAGLNHRAAAAYVRSFDPTRPLHYEGAIRGDWTANFDLSDVVCPMYPSISAIESYAKAIKSGKRKAQTSRPLIMCEYTHAMGNSNGTLKEYWGVIHKYKGLQGGFIWEMWDHGLDQTLPDGTKRSAYGGNYGEKKHDGNFVCDGMFFPDRTPKPAMAEFKYLAAPVFFKQVGKTSGKYQLFNKFFFIDLSGYKLRYEVTVEGEITAKGNLKLPAVKPRKSANISVPAKDLNSAATGERFLNLILEDKSGHEVAWEQFAITSKSAAKPKVAKIVETGLIGFDIQRIVNKDGTLQLPQQQAAPKLMLWRAPTDNDAIGTAGHKWNNWGLRDLKVADCKVKFQGKKAIITRTWKTSKGIAVKHLQTVESIAGQIRITDAVTLPKQLNDVARVGINFEVNGLLNNYTYFGVGPHETVPDRAIGRVGKYRSSVSDLMTDYIKPQENGGRVGVRWFELRDIHGKVLRIELDKPRMVTTSHVRSEDLADATHNVYVKRSGTTVITIDAAHRGVGTASCGPDTLDKYLIRPGLHKFTWTVSII